MKRLTLFALLLVIGMAVFLNQRKASTQNAVNQEYVLALSAANQFLDAWRTRDQEKGLALLSTGLKRLRGIEELRIYISGLSNPHHQAFEIFHGKQLGDTSYAFPVILYEHYTGEKWRNKELKPRELVLVKGERDEWFVDALP